MLLNLPFVLVGLLSSLTQYKLRVITRKRFWTQALFWSIILGGLVMAEPLYNWLYSHNLTQTEPLSLFDVIQITAIVVLLYSTNRTRSKVETLENRLRKLHQELSIKLSEK